MNIGEKIKQLRIEKGLTQEQLGTLSGLAGSAIRRYELGKANPKLKTMDKISNALGVSVYELMGLDINHGVRLGNAIGYLDNDLFDALYNGNDAKLLNEKIDSIISNTSLSDDQKSALLKELLIQGEIAYSHHSNNVDLASRKAIEILMNELNTEGQRKAVEQVELLTKIPAYKKNVQATLCLKNKKFEGYDIP